MSWLRQWQLKISSHFFDTWRLLKSEKRQVCRYSGKSKQRGPTIFLWVVAFWSVQTISTLIPFPNRTLLSESAGSNILFVIIFHVTRSTTISCFACPYLASLLLICWANTKSMKGTLTWVGLLCIGHSLACFPIFTALLATSYRLNLRCVYGLDLVLRFWALGHLSH